MKKLASCLALTLLICALAFAANGDKKITIQDSLAIKNVGAPSFSPDGKWIAYTLSEWDKENNRRVSHIYLISSDPQIAKAAKPIKLTNGEKGESSPQWSPDGSRIAFSADRDKGNQIWLISPFGGEAEKLTSEENGAGGFRWSPDGKRISFITRDTPKDKAEREKKKKDKFDTIVVEKDFIYSHLWTINVESKEKKRLSEGAYSIDSAEWSPDGKWLAFVRTTNGVHESPFAELAPDRNSDIYIIAADGGQARQLTTSPAPDSNPRWSPDSKWLAYTAGSDAKSWTSKTDIMMIAAEGGTPQNLTKEFFESAGNGLLWAQNGEIYFNAAKGVYSQILAISKMKGGTNSTIVAVSPANERIYGQFDVSKTGDLACLVNDSLHTGDIYIRLASKVEHQLTFANPQLKDFALGSTEVIKWKGPDNFDIEGVLVKPLGYEQGKRYPLVLQIHGGPYARFDNSFNSRAQIFAANGYAVLMPNPRGSTGYGNKFTVANLGDWGGKDFKDIMAGVDAAIAKGIADPDKLVVMGGSYGGFMTFWAITQTDRFKAAIGHAGISDWYSFHGQSDIPGLMEYGFVGQPWNATETYRKSSPMTFVDKVKTPIMITHGEQDRRVAIAQAEEYYRALQRRGVEVVFLRFPREGHGIQEPNHQIDLVTRQLAWFDSHLGIKRQKLGDERPLPASENKQ
jgi:dipeptidyl aminopeptidase/acylaminoacyl peptidase